MKLNVPVVESQKGFTSNLLSIIKNVLYCFLFTAVCLFVFAIIITYTEFPDSFISPIVVLLTILSIIFSGILTARHSTSKGWLNGAVTGLIYIILLFCIGSLAFRSATFGLNFLTMLALGILAGALGGIFGINVKHKR